MTPPESTQSALTETSTMTQEECRQLKRHAFWSAFGSAIFIVIWIIAVIAILSASNSPSAAPPIILFGIILMLTIGIGFRAYPGIKKPISFGKIFTVDKYSLIQALLPQR